MEVLMRVVALSMCLLAAACGSQEPGSPISPTSATPTGASQTAATKAAASLPFKGDISGTTMGVFTPPATLEIHLSGEGNATQLGRFTSEENSVGTFPNPVATGTWAFTAANGDRLFATTESTGTPVAPGIDDVKTVANDYRRDWPIRGCGGNLHCGHPCVP
jgi:hypothetical protein